MGAITGKPASNGNETMTVHSWLMPYIERLAAVEEYVVDAKESRVQEEENLEYRLKLQLNTLLERTDTLAKKVDDQSTRLAQAEKALENAENEIHALKNSGLRQTMDTTLSQLDALEIEFRAKLGNDEALWNEINAMKIDLSAWKAEVELKEHELKDEVLSATDKCTQQQDNLKNDVDERFQLLLKRVQWSREEMQQLYNVVELPPHIEAKFLAADVNGDGCMSIKEFLEDKARSRRRYKEE